MLEHMDTLAHASAQAISNIKFDKIVVWDGGNHGGNGSGGATAGFLNNLAHTLPPMLQVMKDIGGVQVPEFIGKLSPDGQAAASKPEQGAPAKGPAGATSSPAAAAATPAPKPPGTA